MNMKAGLFQQQTMKLAMTQELTQAITLLQYNAQELSAFLEDKALENPFLQLESEHTRPMNPLRERIKHKPSKVNASYDRSQWLQQIGETKFSFEEYLIGQLPMKKLSTHKLKTLKRIIHALDENGYLIEGTELIAESLGTTTNKVEECLTLLHCLEPAGVGARNLQECLLIQLEHLDVPDELAETIVADHFDAFSKKKWKEIAKELGVSLKEIQAVYDRLQLLNPKPAASFQTEKASYIVPDAIIDWDGEQFHVEVYDGMIPKISFNQPYFEKFSKTDEKNVSQFLQGKYQDYQWIIKSIEQRKETLLRVVQKIVEKQPEFFIKGPKNLRPMTMKEVAGELDIHESTVSRAVREKYVQTPKGTYDLKSFFTSMIQTVTDENTSSSQVKNLISQLISVENKVKPISDQEIADTLEAKEGIVVSRRTVAKYRDQLGIPSSSKRKRYE